MSRSKSGFKGLQLLALAVATAAPVWSANSTVCTPKAPTIQLTPATLTVARGSSAVYTVTIKDNDSSVCPAYAGSLVLSGVGITPVLSKTVFNLHPGKQDIERVTVPVAKTHKTGTFSFVLQQKVDRHPRAALVSAKLVVR